MRLIRLALGSLLFALVFSAEAQGNTITVYTDASAFAAAVGSTTLINFEAQNNAGDSSFDFYGSLLTVGDVSFTQPQGRIYVFGQDYAINNTQGLTSDYLNQNGGLSGLNVTFASGVSGVGMELGYFPLAVPSNAITFTLSTGDIIQATPPNVSGNNPLVFFGFTSDVPVVSFNVNGPSQGVVIDDFQYAKSLATVPELTSTLSLLGLSMAGLIAARRRFSL